LGNVVYNDSFDRSLLRGRIHPHRENDHRKCGGANADTDAFLYFVYDFIGLALSRQKISGFYFSVAACVLIVTSLLITLLVEVPIDNQIKTWRAESLPPTGR
jgi:hypothetical protein